MFRTHFHVFIDVCGFPAPQKNLADTKLTYVMWCQILIGSLQRHLAAIIAGNRRRGRPVDKIRFFLLNPIKQLQHMLTNF